MKYENPQVLSKEEAIIQFESGVTDELCKALVSVTYHLEDWEWVESQCLEFLDNHDSEVRGLAATCLGHIARIHRKLHKDLVIPRLKKLESDPEIAGRVEDAMDDIEMYIGL